MLEFYHANRRGISPPISANSKPVEARSLSSFVKYHSYIFYFKYFKRTSCP